MLKRLIAMLLLLVCICSSTALAEAKLKATKKNLIVLEGQNTGYFYAKIENVGDTAVSMTSSDLVLFSEDDEIVLTDSFISTIPSGVVIAPGEYLYVNEWLYNENLKTMKVADYKFSPSKRDSTSVMNRLSCEVTLDLPGAESYSNYAHVTFTNTSDQKLESFYIIIAIYDAEENLIYVDNTSYSNIAIHPNGTITVSITVDKALMEHYARNNIVPTTVDAMVCYKQK